MTSICPVGHASRDSEYCDDCGRRITRAPASLRSSRSTAWVATVTADHAYFDAVASDTAVFPVRFAPRRFTLDGPEILIGRHSATRGIAPEIDLWGPEQDMAISHRHAWLERQSDGDYALVDAGSTNGTTINDDATRLPAHKRVKLHTGDRIHIGNWTTIAIEAVADQHVQEATAGERSTVAPADSAPAVSSGPPLEPADGLVTWLVSTNIEGSTRMRQQSAERYESMIEHYQDLLARVAGDNGGRVLHTADDAGVLLVPTPHAAIAVALDILRAAVTLVPRPMPVPKIRIGIDGRAVPQWSAQGLPASQASTAVCQAANGGQVLASAESVRSGLEDALPTGTSLVDVGTHRLANLSQPQQVFQLMHPDLEHDFPPLRVLDNHPNNLPGQLTDFVGRHNELARVVDTVLSTRLCTIVGPGGVGKTRLALQVGARVLDKFADGVWLADLAAVTDGPQVPGAVTDALGLREGGAGTVASPGRSESRGALDRLVAHLGTSDLLLVLNNCEHVLDACGELVSTLLRSCPTLRVLVTSRQPLSLIGETVYRLGPLELPARWETGPSLRDNEAIVLFVNRAVQPGDGLAFTDSDLALIREVCAQVDGVPYAIELAAAQARELPLAQIRQMLDLQLIVRDTSPEGRYSALDAMIDWSHNLLTSRERVLFRRLAIFAGGWDLSAARTICAGDGLERFEIADLLRALVDKSLVESEPRPNGNRYRLLETTRRYAAKQLAIAAEVVAVGDAHLRYYRNLAEEAEPELSGPDFARWFAALDADRENLHAAIARGREERSRDDLRIATALTHFWVVRGQLTEGAELLDDVLTRYQDRHDALRIKALWGRALLACFSGDTERAEQAASEAGKRAALLELKSAKAQTLTLLGLVEIARGNAVRAEQLQSEAVPAAADLPDLALRGFILANHGNVLALQGKTSPARQRYDESIRIRRERGDEWGLAWSLFRSGSLATWEGKYDQAIAELTEANEHARRIGFDQGALLALLGLAEAFYVNADHERAETTYLKALDTARGLEESTGACLALAGLASVAIARGDSNAVGTWLTEEEAIEADRTSATLAAVKASRASLASARGDDVSASALHREALSLRRQLCDQRGMTDQLERLALLASRRGDLVQAATLIAAASRRRAEMGLPVPVMRRAAVDLLVSRIAENMTDAVALAHAAGLENPFDETVSSALGAGAPTAMAVREVTAPSTEPAEALGIRGDAWAESLRQALRTGFGTDEGERLALRYRDAFPPEYWMARPVEEAVADLTAIERSVGGLSVQLGRHASDGDGFLQLKLMSAGPLALDDVQPVLKSAGLRVLDERPCRIQPDRAAGVWLYDLRLTSPDIPTASATPQAHRLFEQMFLAVWDGAIEDDRFNQLVLAAELSAREVTLIRAYGRYLRLIGNAFSQEHIQRTIGAHPAVAAMIVKLFRARFDPAGTRASDAADLEARLLSSIDEVASLDEDRILRSLLNLVQATVRTNWFRTTDGAPCETISFKLDPSKVVHLPLPRPMWEIYVYSPRVEGVHLRGGRVARGGIRWSDLADDFRTEILGLMKAQMVKNTVIVPVGAKGGFIVRRRPSDRAELAREAEACYEAFIRAILDVTDNLVDGSVVPPPDVVRLDGDDPYLVVAADKGTATFADLGNRISRDYGFWLDDAFAAGGSSGYDHKKLGITARGAWESAKRHFACLGVDAQTASLSVVGIGDMSGDVFGNGLLRSPHVKLVAAFDHRDIFIDPDPEPGASFAQREELFNKNGSSWADYPASALSQGGGVYSRQSKSITLSDEATHLLGLGGDTHTPDEVVRAILTAKVDLFYNGGIGTYVRSSDESDHDVGDKTNDAVRVCGSDLRCRVVVEGGNLGLTQRGRVEFARQGGLINTDAIDNSAGVDCSDHEVNIKILLNRLMTDGVLCLGDRDELLVAMTDEVSGLVLRDDYLQAMALARNTTTAPAFGRVHLRYIQNLEASGHVVRSLTALPTDKAFAERLAAGQGLTAPELAVLLAQTKMLLHDELLTSDLPDDPFFEPLLRRYFPTAIQDRYDSAIASHPLRREIIATMIANDMLNRQEVSVLFRLQDETQTSLADIARAYVVAVELFGVRALWDNVESLDGKLAEADRYRVLHWQNDHLERAMRWLLRHEADLAEVGDFVERFASPLSQLVDAMPDVLADEDRDTFQAESDGIAQLGLSGIDTRYLLMCELMSAPLDIVDVASKRGQQPQSIAALHHSTGDKLHLGWLRRHAKELPKDSLMEMLTRLSLQDDLDAVHRSATEAVLDDTEGDDRDARVEGWLARHAISVRRLNHLVAEIRGDGTPNAAAIGLALNELRNLVSSRRPD